MSNDALIFARWLDTFEQENPDHKFASAEQAFLFYQETENHVSEISKIVQLRGQGRSAVQANNFALSREVIDKAIESGEYFYLCYSPGPGGSCFIDLSLRGGEMLVHALVEYAINHDQAAAVNEYSNKVLKILHVARKIIAQESQRRATNN